MARKISIIIVSYNVKELLKECLESIENSNFSGEIETVVVDNNSKDGSVPFLKDIFSNVIFIQNLENLGFSKANNIGFQKATGDYFLILNPDTKLEPSTLSFMSNYMDENPKVGMSGCKVLNEDGTFQLACRRSFPTPWNSFCKLFGLQKLFSSTKIFSSYNLTYKNIDEEYEVDALIGAFMFARKEVIAEVGGFDESFFMYGEDLDLCFQIKKKGWQIVYTPITSIIHAKGESTKRSSIDEVKHFYDAMKIYIRKNYKYSKFFLGFLHLGITLRSTLSYLKKYKSDFLFVLLDLLLINISFLLANRIRFGTIYGFPEENYALFAGILSLVTLASNFTAGSYFEKNYSIKKLFESIVILGILTGFITYLFREIDFSRKVLLLSGVVYFAFGTMLRTFIYQFDKRKNKSKILIVGDKILSNDVYKYLIDNNLASIENISLIKISTEFDLTLLAKLIKENDINKLILAGKSYTKSNVVPYLKQRTLENINIYDTNSVEDFKTKNLIENTIGNQSLVRSKLDYPRYRIFKRGLDIFVSTFFLTLGLPLVNLIKTNKKSNIRSLTKVLSGEYSFVGLKNNQQEDNFKEGFLSLSQISGGDSRDTIVSLNEYYLKNYSIGLDLEIFFKSFGK